MEKSHLIKNIYVYLLSAITFIIFLVSSINTLSKIPDILYPTPYLQTLGEFKSMQPAPSVNSTMPTTAPVDAIAKISSKPESEIALEWKERNDQLVREESLRHTKEMSRSLIWSIVSLFAFLYFNKQRKENEL